MSVAEKLTTIAKNEQKVFDAGKQAEYDAFWDAYQDKGKRTAYAGAFYGVGWTDESFKPKYDLVVVENVSSMFRQNQITNIKQSLENAGVVLDFSKSKQFDYVFYGAPTVAIPHIDCSGLYANQPLSYSFAGCSNLKEVSIYVRDDLKYSNVFQNCTALENLTIEGVIGQNGFDVSWSTKLTHDSLMSIINALQDKSTDTSGTAWVITLGSENCAKLTDAEILLAEQKGWVVE